MNASERGAVRTVLEAAAWLKEMRDRLCLCSDPDYCLRWSTPGEREAAIAYRRERGARLPKGAGERDASDS